MGTVEEIEAAIESLPRDDFYRLLSWIKNRFEDEWDRQIEEDAKAGRLDKLAREALAEYHAGKTTPFPPLPSFSRMTYLPKRLPTNSSGLTNLIDDLSDTNIKLPTAALIKPLSSPGLLKKLTIHAFFSWLRS